MAKKKGSDQQTEVLVDFKSSLEASGAGSLVPLTTELENFASVAGLSTETLNALSQVASSIKIAPNLGKIKEATNTLTNFINTVKQASLLSNNGQLSSTDASKLVKNAKNTAMKGIVDVKSNNGFTLSGNDEKFIKELNDMTVNVGSINEQLEAHLKRMKQLQDAAVKPEDAIRYGREARKTAEQIASSNDAQDRNDERKSRNAFRDIKTKSAQLDYDEYQAISDYIQNNEELREQRAKNFVEAETHRIEKQKAQFIREGNKILREQDVPGLKGYVRRGAFGLEDQYDRRAGFTGFASRFGKKVFEGKNNVIGNAFALKDKNGLSVAGSGANLGGLLFGGVAAAASVAAKAIYNFGVATNEAYGEIEKVKTNLGVVYGNQGQADAVFNDIAKYALKSPFSVSQTAEQSVQLKQVGVEDKDVMDTLKTFGDLASGNQEKFNRLLENFSKVVANQTVTARNMIQFTQAGIPIYKALAEELGVRKSDVRGMVKKGQISADDLYGALKRLTSEGGLFYGAVEKGSRTYQARRTNLEDTKQLALSDLGEFNNKAFVGKAILEFKESWWGFIGDLSKWLTVQRTKIPNAEKAFKQYNNLDSAIDYAKSIGNEMAVQQLKVYKMEVENAGIYTKDQQESVLASDYKSKEDRVLERTTIDEVRKIADQYFSNMQKSNQEGISKEEKEYYNALKYQAESQLVNLGFGVGDIAQRGQLGKENFIQSITNEYAAWLKKDLKSLNKISSIDVIGQKRNWTDREKSYYGVQSRTTTEAASAGVRELAKDKNSTTSLLAAFDKYWQTTDQAKAEQEKQQAEMIQTLKDIYAESQELNLKEDKFGFLKQKDSNGVNKVFSAKEIVEMYRRYMDTENATKIEDLNAENFDEVLQIYKDNINAFRDDFLRLYDADRRANGGNGSDIKYAESILNRIVNATDVTSANKALVDFSKILQKVSNTDLKKLGEIIQTDAQTVEIDRDKLDASKTRTVRYGLDEAYASLQRRIVNDTLGVSLYRTLGMDTGITSPEKRGSANANSILNYFNNNQDRSANKNLTLSLLNQRSVSGRQEFDYKQLSSAIIQGNQSLFDKFNQRRYDDSGRLQGRPVAGAYNTDRYNKGFVDQAATNISLTKMALDSGGSKSIGTVLTNLDDSISKLDQFWAESFTRDDQQERTTQMLKLLDMQYRIETKGETVYDENGNKVDKNTWANTEGKYKRLLDVLLKDDKLTQLGYSNTEEFRTSLVAFDHQMQITADGTKTYYNVLQEMISAKKQELKATADMITAAKTFSEQKEGIESATNTAKENAFIKSNPYFRQFSDIGIKDASAQQKILSDTIDNVKGSIDYFTKVYKEEDPIKITKKIIEDSFSAKGGNGWSKLFEDVKTNNNDVKTTLQKQIDTLKEDIKVKENQLKYEKNYNVTPASARKQAEQEWSGYVENRRKSITAKPGTKAYADQLNNINDQYKSGVSYRAQEILNAGKNYQNSQARQDRINTLEADVQKLNDNLTKLVSALEETANPSSGGNAVTSVIAGSERDIMDATGTRLTAEQLEKFSDAIGNFTVKVSDLMSLGPSIGDMRYGENTYSQQKLVGQLGLPANTNYQDYISHAANLRKDQLTGSDGSLNTKALESLRDQAKYMLDPTLVSMLDKLKEDANLLNNDEFMKGLEGKLEGSGTALMKAVELSEQLKENMKNAFDGAIVDGISNSMVTLGEGLRDGVDATEEINKGLNETFTNLLKSIGPEMTKTGLAITAGAAEQKNWGLAATGLALAAAGGFMSFSGGLLSNSDKKDDDKDAQKEARLKTLADLLSDLIGQARIDAEYYERSMRHEQALSADYGVSTRSVHDMILTPEGNFSTDPDDYIIATKTPNELGGKGAAPKVIINMINQSGENVQIAQTSQKTNSNGDVEIEAVIIAVTSEAIANGDLDGAFALRESRNKGFSKNY